MTYPAPGPPTAAVATARATTPHDAAAIARLCSGLIIFEPLDTTWLATCRNQFAARLQQGGDARAYVIDAPADGLAACALAFINSVLPAPNYPRGLAGRTYAVATEPAPRHQGFTRVALTALLKHLKDEGVTLYELHTRKMAAPLYEQVGFRHGPVLMRMTRIPPVGPQTAP
ncbi:GNAT family N-acetyltransferase [Streptomyces hydrogenans]|uniref:GNAT family N-acetyltransferase n=1 Tax=Streptomyces hydrogenans TaxID=1873719 RepID=UPI0035E0E13A